jgi:hypothetical protein
MTNLDVFDVTCAKLLSRLYEQFPMEIETFRDDELGLFASEGISDDDLNMRLVVSHSITFLKDNGYITYNGWEGRETATPKYLMRLTDKGLARLRREPGGNVANGDLGSALIKTVKNLGDVSANEEITLLVKAVISSGS